MSSQPVNNKDSLGPPPPPPPTSSRPSRRDSGAAEQPPSLPSTSHGRRHSLPTGHESVISESGSVRVSHFSVASLLGYHGVRSKESAEAIGEQKLKGEKARSLLRMLLRTQKTSEESVSHPAIDVHGLVPCGDVAGLLAITVKQCQDFTPKFNVTRDIYLLIRINIDKIMKCTNPQVYRATIKNKKTTSVYFGDVRYFSLKVPKQKGDPRNRIALELVGFEGPMDFPRLFGRVTMHLYEIIKKQAFTEICAMRIRNMVFCTVEVEFMFCYGCLGYGYSHQLKLPGADPAKAVAYSMFLRVPPPENRKDHARNVVKPQQMDYPAFLSPDLNVKVGNQKIEKPPEISDYYKSLQRALQQPARDRLVKMKKEYRSLKTWREKSEYLDQLIVKRGPKTKPKKVSRFRDFVGRIHGPRLQPAGLLGKINKQKEEKKEPEVKEEEKVPDNELKPSLEVPTVLTSSEAEPEEPEEPTIEEPSEEAENMSSVPAVMVSSVTSYGLPFVNVEKDFEGEVLQEEDEEPELVQPIFPELRTDLLDTYDSASPSFSSPDNQLLDQNLFEEPSVPLSPEYVQEPYPWFEASVSPSAEFREPEPEPPVAEPEELSEEQWPWKEAKAEVFTANRFEPFLRRVCRVPPPPFYKGKGDFSELEQIEPSEVTKEQEDQDPPHGMPLVKAKEDLEPKPIKSSEQLSILRLIEKKMDQEEGEQKAVIQEQEKKPLETSLELYQKPIESKQAAEIIQIQVYFRRSLEAFFVDILAKIVALKSLLNKNIENLVTEGFSEVEKSLAFKDQRLADNKQECFLNFRKKFTESDIEKLKFVICQNLQAHLIETLCEKGIIPAIELPEKDLKGSLSPSTSLFGKNKILSEERISQSEILRIKLPSDSQSRGIYKTEYVPPNKETTKGIKTIAKNSDLSKRKIEDDRMAALSFHDGSVEGTNADLRGKHSNQSLEIIKIRLPVTIEPDSFKQRLYIHDSLLEKQLKAELTILKTFLSKGLEDHLKDKLAEIGLNVEYLNMHWKRLFPKDPQEGQVFFNQALAGQTPIFRKSIQNLFEDLSEREIANLKSVWNPRIQEQLSERLTEIRLIIENELKLILESLIPVVAEETPTKEDKELNLSREAQRGHPGSSLTQSLQDKFSEEELQNVKSLFHTLVTEGQTDKLTESEVSGLSSVLRKSFENLPVQNSFETGISKDIEIKDEFISLQSTAEELRFGNLVAPERGKRPSKESLLTAVKNFELPVDTIFETETMNKETQTTLSPKKAKRPRKEGHRLPGYPANLVMADTKTGHSEVGSKSIAQEEHGKRMPDPPSSFLSAHDIGIQTEGKFFFSKPLNILPKPSFPVNPQTFLSLHSESEEEGKPAVMCHHRPRARKPDKKKEEMTFNPQQAVLNPQAKKERMGAVRGSKEVFREKGRKQGEMAAPKQMVIESRKAAAPFASRESLKQKPEKKKESDLKQKRTPSKTALLSESQLQNVPKLLTEKPSVTKYSISGRIKANPLNLAGTEDLDVDAYKHLEKAVERALMDLERSPEGTSSKGRPNTAPGAPFMSKDVHRSFPSSFETPRNQAGSISELLNNQDQIFTMAPEQLEMVLKILHRILRQNTPPK